MCREARAIGSILLGVALHRPSGGRGGDPSACPWGALAGGSQCQRLPPSAMGASPLPKRHSRGQPRPQGAGPGEPGPVRVSVSVSVSVSVWGSGLRNSGESPPPVSAPLGQGPTLTHRWTSGPVGPVVSAHGYSWNFSELGCKPSLLSSGCWGWGSVEPGVSVLGEHTPRGGRTTRRRLLRTSHLPGAVPELRVAACDLRGLWQVSGCDPQESLLRTRRG